MSYPPRIKFFCRSFNKELYLLSRHLYEEAGYPCVRLTDQTADGYFFTMLEDEECDIAINVDEDFFIADLDAVMHLVRRVEAEGWVNAGCSDAGPGVPRKGDASVTNPFFNVFNLREIRKQWDASRLIPELQKDSYRGIEPYYSFFHWMVQTFPGRTLYLENQRHADTISTRLYSIGAEEHAVDIPADGGGVCLIGYHTWFARLYKESFLTRLFEGNDRKDVDHHKRIDAVIDAAYADRKLRRPDFGMADRIGFRLDECKRWCIKVPQRVAGWPRKLKRKFQ